MKSLNNLGQLMDGCGVYIVFSVAEFIEKYRRIDE